MTAHSKQLAKFLIRILITTALLIWVFSRIDLQQFWQTVKLARWEFLFAVWATVIMFFWIQSIKMKLILKKQGCNVNISTLFGASAVTALYSMVIPGILSTGVKWYILKKDTGKGTNILSAMVYNQLSLMVVMTVFGLGALIATNPTSLLLTNTKNQWLLPAICAILLTTIILTSILMLNPKTGGKVIKGISYILKPLPPRIRQKSEETLEQIAIFQVVGYQFHLIIALITIIACLIGGILIYTLSARAANITAPVTVFLWLSAIIYVLGRVPISIANLGVREATLVGLLALYGVEKPAALLMSMILFSAAVFMAIIGAMYQLCWAASAKKRSSSNSES